MLIMDHLCKGESSTGQLFTNIEEAIYGGIMEMSNVKREGKRMNIIHNRIKFMS